MAIQFCEIKKYIARNERISICLEDGSYDDYLMISDIPEGKYDNLYVYGIGTVDVEFSRDMYAAPSQLEGMVISPKHDMMAPAIEIVLHKDPRDIARCEERCLLFKDLKNYLQIGRNFSVVNRKDWSEEAYEWRKDISSKYDHMYVYGIGMEDNPNKEPFIKDVPYDTHLKKRMILVLDDEPRKDVQKTKSFFKHVDGLYFLVFTADEWNHDADEWLGIYIDKKSAREAYDRAVAYYEEERSRGHYSKAQRVVMTEFILEDDRFREVKREELED